MTIYRYGWVAWVWRVLVGGWLGASAFLLVIAVHFGDWWLGAGIILVGVPVVVLPWMLAIRIDRTAEEEIVVTNLFFVRRRISRSALGFPRLRLIAHGAVKTRAPRAWIPVQGGLPIYVDLYGTFPDPVAFRSFWSAPCFSRRRMTPG